MNTISKENQIRNEEYRKNIFNMVNDIENTKLFVEDILLHSAKI